MTMPRQLVTYQEQGTTHLVQYTHKHKQKELRQIKTKLLF